MAGAWAAAPGLTFAAVPQAGAKRLVVVILRGAMDGLAAVQPFGDTNLAAHRQSLLVPQEQLLKLDSFFGLHPAFSTLYGLYQQKQLEVFHAIATPYRARSHFDGQNVLETGLTVPDLSAPGWLNNTVAQMQVQGPAPAAMALSSAIPRMLQGPATVGSWSPDNLPPVPDPILEKLSFLYALDSFLGPRLQQGLQADLLAGGNGSAGTTQDLTGLAGAAGRFLAQPEGPVIAVVQAYDGWDTHVNQGAVQGALAQNFTELDGALAALKTGLGAYWSTTQVLVVTEFGRTVAVNGNGGTDHGTATVAFRLGGSVAGGRIVADWPGLGAGQLYEDRDLRATADLRMLYEAAAQHVLAG